MTTLQPMPISSLGPREPPSEIKSITATTTPRSLDQASHGPTTFTSEDQGVATPTRDSFAAANGKRSLPTSPIGSSSRSHEGKPSDRSELTRESSQRSTQSQPLQDVDMEASDGEDDGSDNESNDETSERPSKKKKKGQRFFCKDYPPCNLSFTRSEHLARHIRKHTGERPFQCHCARRFSRLDNLRQHAQTVHVNEEIPGDSLAATGTRFQRQIRTDRVRPPGPRARASTAGSQGSSHRGHGRNLSTSSIGSTTSNTSTMSTISTLSRENSGRRPHSMNLSEQQSPRGGLTIDTLRSSPGSGFAYANQSPNGTSTPTSYSYSNTPSSPFGSTLGSPVSIPRNPGPWGDRAGRRLSVPSGVNPFQAHLIGHQIQPYMNPLAQANSSHVSASSSGLTSPSSSTYSFPRNENELESDSRRRTWHSSTYTNYPYQRPATSGLSYSQTPDAPRPAFAPQALTAASQTPKLPGIETFDQISRGSTTPPQQPKVPTQPRTPGRLSLFPSTTTRSGPHQHRRNHLSWDISLHQNLTKLDIASGTPPKESSTWSQQVLAEMQNAASVSSQNSIEPPEQRQQPIHQAVQHPPLQPVQELPHRQPRPDHSARVKSPTPQLAKRGGWFPSNAPKQIISSHRPASEDSSSSEGIPTPSNTTMEYQPSIVHASGYIEPQPTFSKPAYTGQPSYRLFPSQEPPRAINIPRKPDTSGLDVLVAAATSESRAQPLAVRR